MAISKKQQQNAFKKALDLIKDGNVSCVVIRGGEIIHTADGRGVSPLLKLYGGEPDKLNGSFVVDKIIGKAAAMLLVLGGVQKAYGEIMSVFAKEYLTERKITVEYGVCVDMISDRVGNGICPIEQSVMDEDDPEKGLVKILDTLKKLANRAM